MKKLLGLLLVGLVAAIAVPSAVMASQPDQAAAAKKKKKTYCQKTGASAKAKFKGKSHGFYVYLEKGGYSFLICQDKPKFFGSFSITKGDKVFSPLVSAKKCAIVKVTGPTHNPQVYGFDFANFLSKNGQASVFTAGPGAASASILGMVLSKNCVAAYGQRVDGVPRLTVQGNGAFGYTGLISPPVSPAMTDKELASVKIAATGATATVTWSEAGVPKTYVYTKPAGF